MRKIRAIRALVALSLGLPISCAFGQSAPEIDWLNKQLFPIHSTQPDQAQDDLQPFLRMVGQARLVGLGECTHGSREIFQMKHRLLKAMVEQLGFTVFALESDFAGAQIVNEFVQTGQGDSLNVLKALGFWTLNTEEVWHMIQWIRAYNQSHDRNVIFAGFDMNVPFPAINAIRQYAIGQQDNELKQWVDELDTFHRRPSLKAHGRHRKVSQLSHQIDEALERRKASAVLQQSARTLVQYADMEGKSRSWGGMFRDRCMAANIDWLLQQHPTAKVALWAHNGHIEKRSGLSKSMGHYLQEKYGQDFVSVGFATGRGTYTAARTDHFSRTNPLVAPVSDSFEYWFEKAAVPNFYLALRNQSGKTPEGAWLTQKKRLRNIGSIAGDDPAYQFSPGTQRLTERYDLVVYLNETSASRMYLARGK